MSEGCPRAAEESSTTTDTRSKRVNDRNTIDGPESVHLTTAELARRWGVSPGTLANHRSAGTSIPYLSLFGGARIVYRLSDVLAAEARALVTPVVGAVA